MSFSATDTFWANELRSADDHQRNDAAAWLFQKYGHRLLALARRNLPPGVRIREDEYDVVQDAFLSFCHAQRNRPFVIANRHEFWTILVTITLRKISNTKKRHLRERRDLRRERSGAERHTGRSERNNFAAEAVSANDNPFDTVEFTDRVVHLLKALPVELEMVFMWKLAGYSNEEVAAPERLNCSVRSVERKLHTIRNLWRELSGSASD